MRREGIAPFHPLLIGFALALCFPFAGVLHGSAAAGAPDIETPTPDRLAPPVMPESPTQVDIGRDLYYFHCMPCHGDRGQGLTDEWRQVWVEDHQDCWARGCHSGRVEDEGFPLPRFVPPLSGSPEATGDYEDADKLFDFLLHSHPPQRPGALLEDECWALTAFLLYLDGRLPAEGKVGPISIERSQRAAGVLAGATAGVLVFAFFAYRRRSERSIDVDTVAARDSGCGDERMRQ